MGFGEFKKCLATMLVILVVNCSLELVRGVPQVPCYFIFGDSLVDNGNNNRITSLAKANYMPYGIDFPAGPTGRFSNGKTTVDVIGKFSLFSMYVCLYIYIYVY